MMITWRQIFSLPVHFVEKAKEHQANNYEVDHGYLKRDVVTRQKAEEHALRGGLRGKVSIISW